MNPEHWKRVEALYLEARDLAPDARARFLRERCGGDQELEREVQRLLDAHDTDSKFIEPPSAAGLGEAQEPDYVGNTFGDFEILEKIAGGGMGVVYRARQRSLNRDVAVKIMSASTSFDVHKRERFEREAQAVARLNHPAMVPVYSVGAEKNVPFFSMEFVHGPDLAHEISRLRKHQPRSRQGLPPFDAPEYFATVASLIADVADGLQHAHDQGVVHRDVKPSNLLIGEQGRPRIVDFGLARNEMLGTITRTHEQAGTPYYMSPEQVRASLGAVDARTDVYSLGIVLYELLTLRRPFEGETSFEVFAQIVNIEPTPLHRANPRVPHDLAVVCHAAMARELDDRYASAAEFRDELRRFVAHEAIHRQPPSLAHLAMRFAKRQRIVIGALLIAGLALLAGNVVGARRDRSRHIDELHTKFATVLGIQDWDEALAQVVEARKLWVVLRDSGETPAELRPIAAELGQRFTADRATRVERARMLLQRGRAGRRDPGVYGEYLSPVSEPDLGEALRILGDARTLYREDGEIERLADVRNTYPTISVRLSPRTLATAPKAAQAIASIRAIDELTGARGERTVLGPLPLENFAIAPGYWRIAVEIPDWGFSEYTRWLQPHVDPTAIVANVRQEATVLRGMRLFEAGQFDAEHIWGCAGYAGHADYEAFWIGEAESSNREYLEFLMDTGHAAPRRWEAAGFSCGDWRAMPLGNRAEDWLELPATGYSVFDAEDFVEWCGKRLPGHIELERALRGVVGFVPPENYSSGAALVGMANINGPRAEGKGSLEEWFATYLENVQPVRDPRYLQLPEGLFHAHGNVAEYTESMVARAKEGILVTDPWQRIYLGSAWDAQTYDDPHHSIATHSLVDVDEVIANAFIGIRCARSATP